MATATNHTTKTKFMVQLALMIAIELILAITPLGYLKINPTLEITLMVVPVAIGAIILGPKAGAVLGFVFGLTSFLACFGILVPFSAFGAALLGINPLSTAFLCFVPRILDGWLTGLIFVALRKGLHSKTVSYFAASLACPFLNTLFFMTGLVVLFYNTDYIQSFVTALGVSNPFTFVLLFVGINGLVEAIVCFLISGVVSRGLAAALHQA